MSINLETDPRFELDLADRMTKALRHSGLGVQELAERIQVSRNAVSSWINGRHKPRRRDLAAFALATGYPVAWLETGEAPHDGGTSPDGLPGLDSNQEPAGFKPVVSLRALRTPHDRRDRLAHSELDVA